MAMKDFIAQHQAFSKEITLEDILMEEKKEICNLFLKHIKKTYTEEALEFWLDVELFKRISIPEECIKQARRIIFRFLNTKSKLEVNVDASMKEELEERMQMGFWDQSLFDKIQESISLMLRFNCVNTFVSASAKLPKNKNLYSSKDPLPNSLLLLILEKYQATVKQEQENLRRLRVTARYQNRFARATSVSLIAPFRRITVNLSAIHSHSNSSSKSSSPSHSNCSSPLSSAPSTPPPSPGLAAPFLSRPNSPRGYSCLSEGDDEYDDDTIRADIAVTVTDMDKDELWQSKDEPIPAASPQTRKVTFGDSPAPPKKETVKEEPIPRRKSLFSAPKMMRKSISVPSFSFSLKL